LADAAGNALRMRNAGLTPGANPDANMLSTSFTARRLTEM